MSGKPFSSEEVNEESIRRGGISRVDICYPTKYYLREMVEAEYFTFDNTGPQLRYQATEQFLVLAKAHPQCVEKGIRIDLMACLRELHRALGEA
ncbi:MAG: hypothetical protein Q8Q67_00615 [bacterium]|nr:hypothetical protein [bacterium]